jgi:GT2 family glycosyltransferase
MTSSATARVTAAVATYNGRALLETLLPSLAAQHYRDFHTVVVDDASSDDTLAWLAENYPEVEVVALTRNVGVTRALNTCLGAGTGELVALLNNDLELHPDFLGELVSALDAHPQASVAAAKLLDFHDRGVIDGAGDVYEWTGEANRRGRGERDTGQYDEPSAIFGACGGAALYRRSALEVVGCFDEDLFAIYEDVDWSFRSQLLGYGVRYVPTAVAYHMGGASIGQDTSDFGLYHAWRNAIWVMLKNYPTAALLRHGHEFLLSQAHSLVWAHQTGRVPLLLRAWRDALYGITGALRKRRAVQASRAIGLAELERVIGIET